MAQQTLQPNLLFPWFTNRLVGRWFFISHRSEDEVRQDLVIGLAIWGGVTAALLVAGGACCLRGWALMPPPPLPSSAPATPPETAQFYSVARGLASPSAGASTLYSRTV